MELLPVKHFRQSNDSLCGPAALKMVMTFWGTEIEEAELARLCKHTYENGTDDTNMQLAAQAVGFVVIIENEANFEHINYWVNIKRIPVIIDWFSGCPNAANAFGETANGHSSVVIGLDEEFIYILDPDVAEMRKITRSDFLRVWFDFRPAHITKWEDLILRQIMILIPSV